MLKILSDPIIRPIYNQNTEKVKMNKSGSNSASGFHVFYHFDTKSVENNQSLKFSADPPHKIWE